MSANHVLSLRRFVAALLASVSVAGVIAATALIAASWGDGHQDGAESTRHRTPPAASGREAPPTVTYDVTPAVEKALSLQGVRIDGRGDNARPGTSADELFAQPGEIRPDSISLVRLTDTEFGQLLGPDGRPVTDPGPNTRGRVTPQIDHQLVWVAVYRGATVPVGGGYVQAMSPGGDVEATAEGARPTTLTTDLYVIRDAGTGEVLSGGSLDPSP
ncbi:hypothetical protein [Nocardioides sp.]|uniref:hypothetical protein n=1 Tax=Nocardioides sp. TaxID=35761 RepID=UPI002EDB5E30